MRINSKSIKASTDSNDGLRICVMRFIRSEYDFDIWFKVLSPSIDLLNAYKNKKITWPQYEEQYLEEMDNQEKALEALYNISRDSNITLLCYEDGDAFCHRRLLADMIRSKHY